MSEERLERILNGVRVVSGNYKDVLIDAVDFDWLVEQSENNIELEEEYKVRQVEYLEEHIDRLEKQNKNYREAIKNVLKDFGVVEKLKYSAQLEKVLEEFK